MGVNLRKVTVIFKCFGFIGGLKYSLFKAMGLILRPVFITFGRPNWLADILKKISDVTDHMVSEYIYYKYQWIYAKYDLHVDNGAIPDKKIMWTAWLQGTQDLPEAVEVSIASMKNHAHGYELRVVTLENLKKFTKIDVNILNRLKNKKISAAHFTDYLRVKLLSEYGGVWLDATEFLTKDLPEDIWDYDLLVWNKVQDLSGRNAYVSIPFVEKFNNGFLVGKRNALFYKFATEISEKLLFDPILEIDYFSNFKAYFAAVRYIPLIRQEWNDMRVINPYGLITRQFWNEKITVNIKHYINSSESFFFVLTYKEKWISVIDGEKTVQQYLIEEC